MLCLVKYLVANVRGGEANVGVQLSGGRYRGAIVRRANVGVQLSGCNCRGAIVGVQLSGAKSDPNIHQSAPNCII